MKFVGMFQPELLDLNESPQGAFHLVGHDGVFLQINTDWVLLRKCIAQTTSVLHFDEIHEVLEFKVDPIPRAVWREFMVHAQANCPDEVAGSIWWHKGHGSWRYLPHKAVSASKDHIQWQRCESGAEGEVCVVDIHSHGTHHAFFSLEDDQDDQGAFKISVVVGNVDTQATLDARLCWPRGFVPLNVTADGRFEVKHG